VKRSRGRGRRPQNNHHHNNHNRAFDSTGPDVKIRGTAAHVYEKYLQLARDAGSAGDRVTQENYLQHAEHYYRILMAQGAQVAQQQQYAQQGQPNGNGDGRPMQGNGSGNANEGYHQPQPAQQADDGDDAG
jgi:uncharacterized protein DUF4167